MKEEHSSTNGIVVPTSGKTAILRTERSRSQTSLPGRTGSGPSNRTHQRCLLICLFLIILLLVFIILYLTILHYQCIGFNWPWSNKNSIEEITPLKRNLSDEPSTSDQKYVRLPENVLPEHYEIFLQVQMPNYEDNNHKIPLSFNGSVNILIIVAENSEQIKLNAHKSVNILSFRLSDSANRTIHIKSFDYIPSEDMVIFNLGEQIQAGNNYNLTLTFEGQPNEADVEGLYAGSYEINPGPSSDDNSGNGSSVSTRPRPEVRWFAVTQMEPAAARKLFPCFDEPLFKAVFSITVVYEAEFTVLSNMPLIEDNPIDNVPGWNRIKFQPSVRMSTYLVALSITTFKTRSTYVYNMNNVSIPINIWARQSEIERTDYALRVASESYVFFEKFYQIPYALPKMDLVSVPQFNVGGMENWGLITFRPFYLISQRNEQSHYGICKVVNHEIAHQWFGNLVTPVWWNDIWLNEGFATFMEYVGMDAIEKDWDVWSLFFVDATMEVFSSDSLVSSHPVVHEKQIKNRDDLKMFFDLISYRKGGAILSMLKSILGDDGFKRGVLNFLYTFQFSSATSNDLWNSFEQSRNKSHIPVSITEMMRQWTLQLGYPLVTMDVDYSNPDSTLISVSQKHFITNLNYSKKYLEKEHTWWHLKLDFTINSSKVAETWLDQEPKQISIDYTFGEGGSKVSYVLANARCEHFYRVNYDVETWRRIVDSVREDPFVLDSATKSCLIDTAWELLAANALSADIALELTILSVRNDTSHPLWKTVKHHLEKVFALMYRSGYRYQFQRYCELIIDLATDASKHALQQAEFYKSRANQIQTFANFIGHPLYLEQAMNMTDDWLAKLGAEWNNNSSPYVHPSLTDSHLCAVVKNRGTDFIHMLYSLFLRDSATYSSSPLRMFLIRAMSCTSDPTFFNYILNQAIEETSKTWRPDELGYFIITGAGQSTNAGYSVLWSYFTIPQKFDTFGPIFKDFTFFFKNILFAIYANQESSYGLENMRKFNETHYDKLGAGQAEFYRLMERVENNVQWTEFARPQVIAWLEANIQ